MLENPSTKTLAMRAWRARNSERNREYQRQYHLTYQLTEAQKDAARERKRKWRLAQRGGIPAPLRVPAVKRPKTGPRIGAAAYNWKGEAVKYRALHGWVERHKGKPARCEICGSESAKKFEWMNLNHQYKRNLTDWQRACTKCHRAHDFSKGLSQPGSRWTNATPATVGTK